MRTCSLLILMLAALTGCCCFGVRNRIINRTVVQKIEVDMITDSTFEFCLELEKERFLRLEQSYAFYEDGITGFQFFFSTQDISEVKEARRLLVEIVEGLLDRVNNAEELASQFQNGPMTAMDLEIFIDFQSFFSLYVDPMMVGAVSLKNGIVRYLASDGKDPDKDRWHRRIERYGIAKRIIEIERGFEETFEQPPPPAYRFKDRYIPPAPPHKRGCLDCSPMLLQDERGELMQETFLRDIELQSNTVYGSDAIRPIEPPRPIMVPPTQGAPTPGGPRHHAGGPLPVVRPVGGDNPYATPPPPPGAGVSPGAMKH